MKDFCEIAPVDSTNDCVYSLIRDPALVLIRVIGLRESFRPEGYKDVYVFPPTCWHPPKRIVGEFGRAVA
jgi:hypothetical protein